MNSQAHAVLSLAPGQARRLGLGGGELTVLRGRVWLTGECGDARPDPLAGPVAARATTRRRWSSRPGTAARAPRCAGRRAAPLLQGLPAWRGFLARRLAFAALARSAASSASRAQGCIKAGDSIASSGALK